MFRRISTKWVLTVLAAVIVPFLGFAWFVDTQMSDRHWQTVRYYLLSTAGELAARLDNEVHERQLAIELWSTATPLTEWAVGDYAPDEAIIFVPMLQSGFNRFVEKSRVYDLILAVNADGQLVVSNTRNAQGEEFSPELLANLKRDYSGEVWFREAMKGVAYRVDHHESDLVPRKNRAPKAHPENYHLGFAVPVTNRLDPEQVVGVVYGLMNWRHIQYQVLRPIRPRLSGIDATDIYASCYAWLWMSDGDTIIGHPNPELYTRKVSGSEVNLPELVTAAHSRDWGMYPQYSFGGVEKNAAFKHCASPEQGGFGWIVGVGIDNRDIYRTVDELRSVLLKATALVLGVVVVGTVLIARRTTRPILELQEHTKRVAAGDLETRVDVASRDELGELAQAFNQMTKELGESRVKLIKAEKDAAWREMARQVAHEIKNPLTPIRLSADLLRRARDEKSPEYDAIFDRTIDMIQRQVEHMRAIAADFSAFAGTRKPEPQVVDAHALLDEVLTLNAAWARELGVEVELAGSVGLVFVDRGELRRVLINLVSNALEAMPHGGRLSCRVVCADLDRARRVVIEIQDSGAGISDEVRARLFEPYFTTRTHGTGLGLAIAARLVDEMSGRIELVPVSGGSGTIARVSLPEHAT